jgi:small-conductance mechanosensitive channel
MLIFRRFVRIIAFASLALCLSEVVRSQPLLTGPALPDTQAQNGAATGAPVQEAIAEKRTQNAEQLRLAQRKLEASGSTDKVAAHDVAYFQTREAVLAQREAVDQQIKDMTSRKARLETQLKSPPVNDKPVTFVELDRLKDDLAADEARAALLENKLATAKANLERSQSVLDENLLKQSQAEAAYEKGKANENAQELAAALERARHDVELANDMVALRKIEVTRERLAQEVQQLNEKSHQEQVARLTPLVKLTEAEYQAQIAEIKNSQDTATNSLTQANNNLRSTELELTETRKQLEAATGPDKALITEKAAAQWRTKQRLTEEIDAYSQRIQQLRERQVAWERRYALATTKLDPNDNEVYAKLKSQKKETAREIDELESTLRIQIMTMRDIRNQLTSVAKKAAVATNGPADALVWIQVQQTQLEETLRIYDQKLVTVDSTRRVHEKLLDELNARLKTMTPKTVALSAWYQFKTVWDYPFARIDSNKPVRVGMAIKGLATLVVGWMLARFASAMVAYRLLKRFRLSKDATSAIKALVFYSVLAGVALQAMHMVDIDLTAFTILGGALAIGVGFGSQALINNFIGGLIMLAERPVRLGERIKFDGADGIVEDVGFRCTKLRTNADHLLTIPNSTLVNQSIENIDRRRTIRRKMNIPLTYNLSHETLSEAVQAIRDILEEREIRERIHPIIGFEEYGPRVYFSEFATESLTIQVVYWYAPADWWAYMEHAERVNFRIMEEFARLGIDFAFPSKTSFVKNAKKPPTGREPGSFAA